MCRQKFGFEVLYIKGYFYFRSAIKKKVGGEGNMTKEGLSEVPTPGCVVFLLHILAFFFLFSIIYLFRELETGKRPWRFSSYLNRTVWGLCYPSAVIGNHFYHAPIFQKQYNPILWPMNQGFPFSQHERLGPGRTRRKISTGHSFCRGKLTKENLVDSTFNSLSQPQLYRKVVINEYHKWVLRNKKSDAHNRISIVSDTK